MLNKRIINTGGGGAACTTDTTQILDAGSTQSIALYRFEDNAFDTSESTGYINKGAVFNGSSSKVALPAGSFKYTSQFSIAAWIKQTAQDSSDVILENYEYQGSTSRGFIFRIQSGKLRFDGYYSDSTRTEALSNASIPLNVWTHVAVVWNSSNSTIKLYINGSEVTYSVQTFNQMQYHTNCPTTIGALCYTGYPCEQYYTGYIDELRVYDDALTTTEIGYIANNTTASIPTGNLVALYSFEGNANDSVSPYINGTASNVIYDYSGTESSITYATGKFGKAAVFNGSSSRIDLPVGLGTTGTRSNSLWIKVNTIPSSGQEAFLYIGTQNANQNYETISITSTNKIKFQQRVGHSTDMTAIESSETIIAGNWYHIATTHDGTTAKLYINGDLSKGGNVGFSSYVNNSSLVGNLGAFRALTPGYDGLIDQYRRFNKALSSGEINSLYNETTTTAALGTIDNPSTVAYYKMADASDETGSYDGTAYGVDFNVQGKYGFAGKFSGSSGSYIQTGYTALPGTSASISLWVNINAYTSYGGFAIDSTGTGAQARFTLGQGNTAGKLWVSVGNGSTSWYDETTVSISSYGLGNWFHLVGTVDGTTVKIYINESLIHTFTSSVSYIGGGQHTYYLGGWGNSLLLNGKLDQIRFFNKEISASEVTKLYNEIQCANTIATPESYFNTKLYTGNGGTQALTGVGFAPGMTWIKARSVGYSHSLQDTLRGPGTSTSIYPDLNSAAGTYGSYGQISAFGTDGFTVASGGHGSYPVAQVNQNGVTYASWNWKAASSNTTNNDGTISSTVRASQESGFSIVKYTGTGSASTVGHSLGIIPNLIIVKRTDSSGNWIVGSSEVDSGSWAKILQLDLTDAEATYSGFNNTAPTSSVFSIGSNNPVNANSGEYIAYCFANIDGYQRIGSYVGNGSANGPFIYTGFEPAWVIIKNTTTAYRWYMLDNKRDTTNPNGARLFADAATAEATNSNILNFHTNGFELITSDAEVNKSGDKILFWAIAANPDTTAPTKANSFKTKIYTGNGGTQSITGLGFKPDFVWLKNRGPSTRNNRLFDSLRGATKGLSSDLTNAEYTENSLTAFNTDGFTLGTAGNQNVSSETYVSWNWKALDHDRNLAAINTDGTITSQVSANQAAGFSIVRNTGTSNYSDTIGHGLSQAPEIVIQKGLSHSVDWYVLFNIDGAGGWDYGKLNKTDQFAADSPVRFSTNSTTINNWGWTNYDMINYCWHSVAGYSKIGTYTGSGASGKEVALDFSPSFVMIKRTNGTAGWIIVDDKRGTKELYPNVPNAEDTSTTSIVLGTNKFTLNSTGSWYNASGGTYLYMAFK